MKAVVITGSDGGIGRSLVEAFSANGWTTIGVDRNPSTAPNPPDFFLQADIGVFCKEETALIDFSSKVRMLLGETPVAAIVNNAALQILAPVAELSVSDFVESLTVNAMAPFALVKAFLSDLRAAKGSVINIGSVHAQATKPGFAAYASSKTALHGLTRALAVDLGPDIRVNTLAPAATETSMLKAGFENNQEGYKALLDVHPLGRIASPEEMAKIAVFLASQEASFLTGATIFADGGILSRLHDPA